MKRPFWGESRSEGFVCGECRGEEFTEDEPEEVPLLVARGCPEFRGEREMVFMGRTCGLRAGGSWEVMCTDPWSGLTWGEKEPWSFCRHIEEQ